MSSVAVTWWLPRAIWRATRSSPTATPFTDGTTETLVPEIANVASLGGVSTAASPGPSAVRSATGSTRSARRESTIWVRSAGLSSAGLQGERGRPGDDLHRRREQAPRRAGRGGDLGRVDGGTRRPDA